MNKYKIFFDTDIGDDIDDALALIFLLKMQCEVVGVSTVYANTPLRTRLCNKILSLAGRRDIPVYSGRRKPFKSIVDVERSFGQASPELLEDDYAPINDATLDEGEAAIDALIAAARKYKEELIILAVGPFTNIAAAIQKDCEAFEHVNKIVLMGGCFYEQFVEYNVFCDPEAADYIFKSGLNIHLIGGDVTWKVQLNDEQTKMVLDTYSDDLNGYCAELVRMWKAGCWFNPVLHDPLAAYYAVNPDICKLEPVWTEVELDGSITRGLTVNRDHFLKYLEHKLDNNRILCAYDVDVERFIDEFLKYMF